MQTFIRRLTVVAAIGMFIVLVQGALVTTTESADGCGNSWPLCNGKFVPGYAVESMIEYSHRFVVGIETFLIVGAGVGAWWYWRDRKEIKILAPIMVSFLFIQAALGAAAVKWPQTPEILALHFGVSLIAFASTALTAIFLYEQERWDRLRDRPIPGGFKALVFSMIGYTYLVVYLGAYVRHKEVSLACGDWPLCNGQVFPGFDGNDGIVFTHRLSALLMMLLVSWLVVWAWQLRSSRPDLFVGSLVAGGAVILQAMSGAWVVWTQLDTFSTMFHGVFISIFWGALTYLGMHVLPRQADAEAASNAQDAEPAGARVPGRATTAS